MFENMAGPVGFAIHEDRLARAAKEMRLAEATQKQQTRGGVTHHEYRQALVTRLIALATRLARSNEQPRTA